MWGECELADIAAKTTQKKKRNIDTIISTLLTIMSTLRAVNSCVEQGE